MEDVQNKIINYWFNYDKNDYEGLTDGQFKTIGDLSPYIPHKARPLYRCYVGMGHSPQDAMLKALEDVLEVLDKQLAQGGEGR